MSEINHDLHEGDYGTVLEIEVVEENELGELEAVNISSGTTLQFKFIAPNGTELTKTSVLTTDGSDGKMRYIIEPGFLNQTGIWQWMGFLALANWTGHTAQTEFYVNPVLF